MKLSVEIRKRAAHRSTPTDHRALFEAWAEEAAALEKWEEAFKILAKDIRDGKLVPQEAEP